jgi:hypothetical protein
VARTKLFKPARQHFPPVSPAEGDRPEGKPVVCSTKDHDGRARLKLAQPMPEIRNVITIKRKRDEITASIRISERGGPPKLQA